MLAENSCVCVVCWFEHLMVNSLDRHHSLSSKSFSHCGAPAGLLSSFLLILHLLLLSFRKCPFVPLSLISLCSCQLKVRGQQHWARCMLGQLPPDLHTDNNNCKFFFYTIAIHSTVEVFTQILIGGRHSLNVSSTCVTQMTLIYPERNTVPKCNWKHCLHMELLKWSKKNKLVVSTAWVKTLMKWTESELMCAVQNTHCQIQNV